jgi:sialate O-acetylesterase
MNTALSAREATNWNHRRKSIPWLVVVGLLGANLAWGEVRLPRLVGDHMVLQRDSKITLWGWADPGESVQIDFQNQQLQSRAGPDGRWQVSVGPFPAGGPYELTVQGSNLLKLHDILIGDVWVASGQSNMEFPLKAGEAGWMTGVLDWENEIATADYPRIRLFHVSHEIALKPRTDVEAEGWTAVSPETVGGFSAVAYLFGRELFERYNVPVGLIESNWGGTMAEAWVSAESLQAFPEFQPTIEAIKTMDEKAGLADYDRYLAARAAWMNAHATEDRGRRDGQDLWVANNFDDGAWPTIVEPQTAPEARLKGFDGVVWFRRPVEVPADLAGKGLRLHLAGTAKHDETYFNGEKIGESEGWDKPRSYLVPGRLVRLGQNVVVVRQTGFSGWMGMFCEADKLNLEFGHTKLPLAGTWSYQTGPDLSTLPAPSAFAKFHTDPNTASVLFNGMIAPLTPFRIKGVIWYQGESNAVEKRTDQYRALFPALINDWRNRWGYPLPFLFVQLAGFGANKPEPAEYPWAELREAQSATLSLPGTGMATAVDLGDEKDVHPRNKQDLAHRLALVAANQVYGEDLVSSGPAYQSMAIEGGRIRIKFSALGSGWVVKDKYGYIRGFEIAAADGKFVWAQARQDGPDIVVFNDAIRQPVAVRYDWCNTPDGNLYNAEGFPALPFRTDGAGKLPK